MSLIINKSLFQFNRNLRPILIVVSTLFLVLIFDIGNIDNIIYQYFCVFVSWLNFTTFCPKYYDIQIWDFLIVVGTISAGYFAYRALIESNKRLEIEQSPYIVFTDRITTNAHNQVHTISLKNIGRGSAMNIIATADPQGLISIIDGSNPHSIDLLRGEYNTGWAINENRTTEGLKQQGIFIKKTILEDIPDENKLTNEEKDKSDFNLFLWYRDQLENKYKTVGKFRHSGYFLKLMDNKIYKV